MADAPLTPRPSFHSIYMTLAELLSERSTCQRLKVGCVITSTDFRKVLAVGYNGNVSKGRNTCDRHGAEAVGNCGCLHAEENAVINCDVPRVTPKIVFCTHLPCEMCAKRLINLGGVTDVFYEQDYRVRTALPLFDDAGITHWTRGESTIRWKRG
jgi:dCMP deaminase